MIVFHNRDILADTDGGRAACGFLPGGVDIDDLHDFLADCALSRAAFQLVG